MDTPPIPLAYVLETVREVRMALAYVPQLCTELKFAEAYECIDEQLHQLAELLPAAERLSGGDAQQCIDSAVRVAGAAVVLVNLEQSFVRSDSRRRRSSGLAADRPSDPDGFRDVPLF